MAKDLGVLLCMGLFLQFSSIPTPRSFDVSDHRLSAGVHVLNRYLLVTFAAMLVQRVEQHRRGAGKLVRLVRFSRHPSKVCSPSMARR